MYVCTCVDVCMYICTCLRVCTTACMYVCMYVYVCVMNQDSVILFYIVVSYNLVIL